MERIENRQGVHISQRSTGAGSPEKPAAVEIMHEIPPQDDQVSLTGATALSAGTEPIDLRIVHLNDVHGNIEPQVDKNLAPEGLVGGLAYMGSVVKSIQADDPESLFLNAGDLVQGSFESEVSHGKPIMEVMNHLGVHALELGNHDFAQGRKALYDLIEGIEAPVLGANIIDTAKSRPIDGIEAFIIREIKGIRVGIIGVDTPKVAEYVRPEEIQGMSFPKPEEIVRKQIDELRNGQGVDIIIVASHLGTKDDRELAEKVAGIDVIVGGHTHDALLHGERAGTTILVQAGCNNQYVGDLSLSIDPSTKKILSYSSRLIPVTTDTIAPDPAIEKIIAPYLEAGRKAGAEVVGQALDDFRYSYKEVTPLGQHMADALREAAGAKLALCSGKMLRAGLKKGDINRKQLFNSYPNTEDVVRVKLRGKHIREELESRFTDDSRAIILPSGFSFMVDKSRPNGDRITSITVDGAPMDMDMEYDIAVTDNQARYASFKTAKDLTTVGSLRDAWFTYVKKHSPLANELDGRITMA